MSNKTQLQANNTNLASLIQTLQGKAAGSGSSGGIETCTITRNNTNAVVGYVDVNGQAQILDRNAGLTIECMKNTLVSAYDEAGMNGVAVSGGEELYTDMYYSLWFGRAISDITIEA